MTKSDIKLWITFLVTLICFSNSEFYGKEELVDNIFMKNCSYSIVIIVSIFLVLIYFLFLAYQLH